MGWMKGYSPIRTALLTWFLNHKNEQITKENLSQIIYGDASKKHQKALVSMIYLIRNDNPEMSIESTNPRTQEDPTLYVYTGGKPSTGSAALLSSVYPGISVRIHDSPRADSSPLRDQSYDSTRTTPVSMREGLFESDSVGGSEPGEEVVRHRRPPTETDNPVRRRIS